MTDYYLVAYDISCPKRLALVHRCLTKIMVPVQYSVFAGPLTRWELRNLVADLHDVIHIQRDDVRIYAISRVSRVEVMGRQLQLPWLTNVAVRIE